jgi:hypothetical protein
LLLILCSLVGDLSIGGKHFSGCVCFGLSIYLVLPDFLEVLNINRKSLT